MPNLNEFDKEGINTGYLAPTDDTSITSHTLLCLGGVYMTVGEDPAFAKYFKMIKLGLPPGECI